MKKVAQSVRLRVLNPTKIAFKLTGDGIYTDDSQWGAYIDSLGLIVEDEWYNDNKRSGVGESIASRDIHGEERRGKILVWHILVCPDSKYLSNAQLSS